MVGRWMVAALGFAVVASSVGCANTAQTVRQYASAELRCPAETLRVREIAPGTFRASGCGRRAYYMDVNAPSVQLQGDTRTDALVLTGRSARR